MRSGQDINVLEYCATVMDSKSLICHGIISFQRHFKKMKLFERLDFDRDDENKCSALGFQNRCWIGLGKSN